MTLKKKALALTLTINVVFILVLQAANIAKAQQPEYVSPRITINADGTVTPETEYVTREGNVYTLTSDIHEEYSLEIKCSNIVVDGAGHSITYSFTGFEGNNIGLVLDGVTNVTVKDLEVNSYSYIGVDVHVNDCSNCSFFRLKTHAIILLYYSNFNVIAECNVGPGYGILDLALSSNNIITENNIADRFLLRGSNNNIATKNNCSVTLEKSHSNIFFENNFSEENNFRFIGGANVWDNGSVGNYWIDYLDKHPFASEVGDSGVYGKWYIIDENNVDHYPLVAQFVTLDPQPSPEPQLEPLSFVPVAIVSVVAVAVTIGVFLLVHFKKREQGPSK